MQRPSEGKGRRSSGQPHPLHSHHSPRLLAAPIHPHLRLRRPRSPSLLVLACCHGSLSATHAASASFHLPSFIKSTPLICITSPWSSLQLPWRIRLPGFRLAACDGLWDVELGILSWMVTGECA